jgi:signal transduction histidine kinase
MLTVALTIISLLGSFKGSSFALLFTLLLLVGYALLGTVVWRGVIRGESPRAVNRYFIGQFAFIALLMTVELLMGVSGLSTSTLGVGLMMQASVLRPRDRIVLFAGLLLLILTLYARSMGIQSFDLSQVASYIVLFSIPYGIGLFLGLLIVREERARETSHRLDESNRKLAQYAGEVERLSTIQERNRLAREIHDNLGHYLTAVNMQLEVAMMHLPPDEENARPALDKAQALTKEALSEIRRSISALRATPIENRTLHEAIELLVAEHRAIGNKVDFRVVGTIRPCSAMIEMAFYRIAQEGLTNIRKHAQATSADLVLNYSDSELVSLDIRDDGIGSERSDGGFGLLGIQERVQLLGGTLTIDTAKGRGFLLKVVIPG